MLTGVFMYLTGLFADDPSSFLVWSALFLAPFGLVTAYMLARMTAWRALLWSLAPAVILYAFHNWDLSWSWPPRPPASTSGGRSSRSGRRCCSASAARSSSIRSSSWLHSFSTCGSRKRNAKRSARRIAGAGPPAINLPFMIANFEGWSITYTFHEQTGAELRHDLVHDPRQLSRRSRSGSRRSSTRSRRC